MQASVWGLRGAFDASSSFSDARPKAGKNAVSANKVNTVVLNNGLMASPSFDGLSGYPDISSMSSPQQTRVPPPAFVTVTSLPHMLQTYFSPTFSTAINSSLILRI